MNDEEQEKKITVIEQRQATMESDIKEIKAVSYGHVVGGFHGQN